jgi:hypothetical protein
MEQFIRPKAEILSEESLIPDENLISPPPNQFTHELKEMKSYYYISAAQATPPDGEFPEGAKVVLLRYDGGSYCRVVDERGIYAETEYDGLRKL